MKRFFRIPLYCICLFAWIVVGCDVKKPDNVISESQMEELLYDYHMAQALGENLPYGDNYKKAIYTEAVFRKYNTTEAAFDSSMVWYTRNTEVLSKMYERVTKRIKAQQDEVNHLIAIRDRKPKATAPGDSIDIWAGFRMAQLTGLPLNDKLTFVLPADTNFKKRDTLLWEVRYRFLEGKPDKTHAAIMAMQIVYKNDSVIGRTKRISTSGIERIRLQSDTLGLIKEVRGFIYYPRTKQQTRTLLADKISLMRYHCTDSLTAAARDSLRSDSLKVNKADSLKKVNADSVIQPTQPQRLRPAELNRRSNEEHQAKPEQVETEKRIQQERLQMQQERRNNRRPNAPARRRN